MIRLIKSVFKLGNTLLFNRKFVRTYKASIVLRSMEKSGTNYLRLILTNYLYNLEKWESSSFEFVEIDYLKMKELYPNVRSHVIQKKEKYKKSKKIVLDKSGDVIKDFMYDHFSFIDYSVVSNFISPKKRILLYRNPFDILISRYYYFYKNRMQVKSKVKHPRNLIHTYIPKYARTYKWMKKLDATDDDSILVSYELLKLYPNKTISEVLRHLNLAVYDDLVELSIKASSIDNVRKTEKKLGKPIHAPKEGVKGSFVRSGKIGQWQDFFYKKDILKIKEKLKSKKVDITDFITSE